MKFDIKNEPRKFNVNDIVISDFGKMYLKPNEMISFVTDSGKEFDFTAKEWGFYVTPSINGRLKTEGFKSALVVNEHDKLYVMSVEIDKIEIFEEYLQDGQDSKIICWLDDFYAGKK